MSSGAAAGEGISGIGDLIGGQSSSNALQMQADLQMKNAAEAEAQGAVDANKSSLISGHQIGSEVASFGASGVTSNSGSVQAVLSASASNAEMDRLNILHGADIRSIQYQNQASMERMGAASAKQGSMFSAGGMFAMMGSKLFGTQSAADASSLSAGGDAAVADDSISSFGDAVVTE